LPSLKCQALLPKNADRKPTRGDEAVTVHSNHAWYRRQHGDAVPFRLFQQQFLSSLSVFRLAFQIWRPWRLDVFCHFRFRDSLRNAFNDLSDTRQRLALFHSAHRRLEPAYIVSLLLAFLLTYAAARTPGYRGPSEPSPGELLLQFVYLAPWFDVPWLNVVAWTLAIEFQFYLFMLLAAPLLLSSPGWPRLLFFAAIAAASFVFGDRRVLFHYLPCFALGFAVFLFYIERIKRVDLVCLCGLFLLVIAAETTIPTALVAANFHAFYSRTDQAARSCPVVPRNDLILPLPGSYTDRRPNYQPCDADFFTMDTVGRICRRDRWISFGRIGSVVFPRATLTFASENDQSQIPVCSFDNSAR
jgi:hypothetical protein